MYKKVIQKMSLEDKIAFCSGKDFWHTKEFKKYGIHSIMMADGPHGLRKQKEDADMLGINDSVPSTCFPTAVTSGATWNRELIGEMAKAIGEEAREEKVPLVLGPGANIKRNPLCGRNFEYFSEDPYITGELSSAYIKGMQSTGVGTSLKHFAGNSQEYKRFSSDSQLDERTLREIYLSGFETAIKEAQPASVMCAYPQINGTYCSDSKKLLTDILREEWGFQGMVVTDWGAMNDRIKGFRAGCDLSMPGGSAYQEKDVLEAVKTGRLSEDDIDKSVERILEVVAMGRRTLKKDAAKYDRKAHQDLAAKVASEGAVLLKNDENILPLKEDKKVTLIGNMAREIRYQGAGSSHITPTKLISVIDGMEMSSKHAIYIEGCDKKGNITPKGLQEVEDGAREADIAIVFAGLTDQYESEGFDRENMDLPAGHNQMIEAALRGNPNTIVVLMGGSVMLLPWLDQVKAVLYMGLCGQSGGQAIVDLLYGRVSPSGKLTETWPMKEEDVPSYGYYGGNRKNAQYREGIYVGYRYYEKAEIPVQFPFGYGLSYTEFSYTNLQVKGDEVTVTIGNVGTRAGAEVVQLYVGIGSWSGNIYRAKKELKGFEKVYLQPGEQKEVTFILNDRSFSIYQNGWKIPSGKYEILVGASSADIRVKEMVEKVGDTVDISSWLAGSWYESPAGYPIGYPRKEDWELLMGKEMQDDPVLRKGSFEINNTLMELRDYSVLAKTMCTIIEKNIAKGMGMEPDYTNPEFRMAACSSVDCSMRGMIINSCGKFPPKAAECIVEMANGSALKGISRLVKR